jgi:hypothetical protein
MKGSDVVIGYRITEVTQLLHHSYITMYLQAGVMAHKTTHLSATTTSRHKWLPSTRFSLCLLHHIGLTYFIVVVIFYATLGSARHFCFYFFSFLGLFWFIFDTLNFDAIHFLSDIVINCRWWVSRSSPTPVQSRRTAKRPSLSSASARPRTPYNS